MMGLFRRRKQQAVHPVTCSMMESLEERRLLSSGVNVVGPAEPFQWNTGPQTINFTFDDSALITDPAIQLTNITTGSDATGWLTRTSGDEAASLNYRVDHTDQDGIAHTLDRGNYDLVLSADQVRSATDFTNLPADVQAGFFFQPGDVNHDRTVNQTDWSTMTNNVPIPFGATYSQGDVNYDGMVGGDEDAIIAWYGTTLQPPPIAPNTINASGGPNLIDLQWTLPAGTPNPDGFGIWRSTDGNVTWQFYQQISDGAVRSFPDTGLADGTKYGYRIRAWTSAAGYSETSNPTWAVTSLPGPINPPTVSDIAVDHLTLTWDDNTTNEVGFDILVTDPNDQQTAIPAPAHAGTGQQSYTVNILLPDTEYSFQVRSKTDAQVSAWSPPATAVVPSRTIDDALNAQIDAALVGHVPADVAMFSTIDPATSTYVRNPNFWFDGDLTCVSVSQHGLLFKMTAIDPEYVISCSHATDSTKDTMQGGGVWIGSDGSVNDRQIIDSRRVLSPLEDGSYIDIKVGRLNLPLPPTVTPARILPTPWDQLFNGELHTDGQLSTIGSDLGIITLNQDTYASVDQADFLAGGAGSSVYETRYGGPIDPKWNSFYVPRRINDSGSPAFLPFFGSTVLLGCWTSYYYGASALLNKDHIDAAITGMGGDSTHWLKEAPYPARIVPNAAPINDGPGDNPQAWGATSSTPENDIQTDNGVQAILYPGAGEAQAHSKFPVGAIAGIDTVTRVDVTGTVPSWSNSTDGNMDLTLALSRSDGTALGATQTLLTMSTGQSSGPVPVSTSWTGLALRQADLDDMTLDLWAQVNSSPLGSAYILFGNVTVTITYG